MPARPRIFWISGWSVPAEPFASAVRAAWPEARHTVTHPGPDALTEALASQADVLAGFSFGAHLLLTVTDPRPRLLLAPFADLKREASLGGAVATTQLKHLRRWLQRDPPAAVADFHQRTGLNRFTSPDLPPHLAWGLEQMLAPGRAPAPLPPHSIAVAGRSDPLLDPQALIHVVPHLHLVDAGHEPEPLLAAALPLMHIAAP